MPQQSERRDDEYWRAFLTHPDTLLKTGRHVLARLPSSPRCQLCAAPFSGIGRPLMAVIGKRQSLNNPNMCDSCEKVLIKHHGGAEVEGSMLFADIR
ncbi:MAG TPA: hypothetical protein VHK63_04450, partial [Candidatus Limnocylindria bacterium]|nr:hypothetical protein [Candidatus Limnocylindria bacterium]